MNTTQPNVPRYCIWELTLACNARCVHCGSKAGHRRAQELSTDEALDLMNQLGAAGTQRITFSGGEPLLRDDWRVLADAATARHIRIELITNGLRVADLADDIAGTGFFGVTFSVDGPANIHDNLRGINGALNKLLEGAAALKRRGVKIGAATQINTRNQEHLSAIHHLLRDNGFDGWQLQLTMPQGMAAQHNGVLCLSPGDLPALERQILAIKADSPLFIQAADNLGYMSRHEPHLRCGNPGGKAQIFTGCQAGLQVVGIASDGAIRGCLSQSACFNEGNIRDDSFENIWNRVQAFKYNRQFKPEDLTGPCATCPFNQICRAGCKSLAHATGQTVTENKYCLRLQQKRVEM